MSPATETQTVPADRPEKPTRRTRRVLSERTVARRKKLVDQLVDPGVVAEDVELLTDQANSIYLAFKPRNAWQDWLTSTIATIMVRINRCERVERKLRDLASYRAIDFWEDDQILEVETLACQIERNPTKVVAKLRQTPAGLDWLLKRWRFLAKVDPLEWTFEQRELAARLVGGDPEVDPAALGFAAEAVAELESQRGRVEDADAILRGMVEADLADQKVPGLATLRRYDRSLHRQLKWYVDQFHVEHPDRWDDPRRKPAFEAVNAPTHKPAWSFNDSKSEDETKPFAPVIPEPPFAETKPTSPQSQHKKNETNPTGQGEPTTNLTPFVPQVFVDKRDTSNTEWFRDKDDSRPRRLDPVREVARRQKAARRREALACGSADSGGWGPSML